MELFHNLILGFSVALTLQNLLYCFLGVFLGTMIGVLPGIGANEAGESANKLSAGNTSSA